MKVEYINPFISSTISVFDTMLGCQLTRKDPYVKGSTQPEHEISGIIGLSGRAKGTVVLSLSRDAALKAAEAMLGEPTEDVNADVIDAVGELTNMIAGGAKAQLERFEMNLSIPNVITGKGHTVEFPRDATPVCIPFDCPWGLITVEFGLVEQPVAAMS
jgi:chemotaxis protein CheX